jgi:opine dehydrogenase
MRIADSPRAAAQTSLRLKEIGVRLAVLGGGHGCYAAAAEMSEAGHDTWFWRRDPEAFEPVLRDKTIRVRDFKGQRDVAIPHPTTSLEEAIPSAQAIIVPLPALSHEDLARAAAPYWRDGQVVFLPPGTLGSLIFAKAARDAGNTADVSFAETGTLPYLVRKHGPAEILVSCYATRLPTGVFPAKNSTHAFAILEQVYPAIERIKDVLSGALMNAGPIIHPPLIIMNAGPLEHFPEWDIHNEGTQPAIRAVTTALDAERMALREDLGYAAPHFPLADHYSKDGEEWMYGNAAHEKLTDSGDWREHIVLKTHRYMREDTGLGLSTIVSVARWAGFPAPVASGLLAIASAVVGEDLYASGRTLENLGLADLDRAQMTEFLTNGY